MRRGEDFACGPISSEFRYRCDMHIFLRESAMINVRHFLCRKEIKLVGLISISIFKNINYKDYINIYKLLSFHLLFANFYFLVFLVKKWFIDKIAQMENIVNKRTSAKAKDIYFLPSAEPGLANSFPIDCVSPKMKGIIKELLNYFPKLAASTSRSWQVLPKAQSRKSVLWPIAWNCQQTLLSYRLNEPHSTKLTS